MHYSTPASTSASESALALALASASTFTLKVFKWLIFSKLYDGFGSYLV